MDGVDLDCVIALDVGGSSVKSGVVRVADPTGVAVSVTPIDCRGDREAILSTLTGVLTEQLRTVQARRWRCRGVGVGFPGPFDYRRGVALLRGVDKYEALYGVDLGAAFGRVLGDPALRLRFGNDAVGALLAEARYGAGRGYERVLGVALGTGMGSAFIADGEQVTAGRGVPAGGYLYAEPVAGTVADELFSSRGLKLRLRRAGTTDDIPTAAGRARAGDPDLRAVFAAFGRDLGAFLAPYAADFGADAVVLAGGLSNTGDLFAESLTRQLSVPHHCSVLGEKAGVVGASLLIC